jgi:hypothetical protein
MQPEVFFLIKIKWINLMDKSSMMKNELERDNEHNMM